MTPKMKSKITKISLILLAITLVYMAGFAMLHSGGHQECAAANIVGGKCAPGSSLLETATLHLDTLKRISVANLASFALGIFAIFLILFSGLSAAFFRAKGKFVVLQAERIRLFIKTSSLHKKLDWLITREKRDPAISFAVSA